MKIKLDKGAFPIASAHEDDAGYDIRTPIAFTIPAFGSAVVDTGVHIELPRGTVGFLKSKSGLNVNSSLVGEGVIDVGYTGSIKVKLYSRNDRPIAFSVGDKIIQLVILPFEKPTIEVVDELEETERGDNGFGSTGR